MYQVSVTSDAVQDQNLVLADGSQISIEIRFVPMQFGWFFNYLNYGAFSLNGFRIVNSPNMLQQYRNLIPFGLACFSLSQREPSQQTDFSSGNSNLYILSSDDVVYYNDILTGVV